MPLLFQTKPVSVGCTATRESAEVEASLSPHVVERVAAVEHEQWMRWSKTVAPEVSTERRIRWEKLWVPYKDLSDEIKELDREFARLAIAAMKGSM